jgi:hypothetical protein
MFATLFGQDSAIFLMHMLLQAFFLWGRCSHVAVVSKPQAMPLPSLTVEGTEYPPWPWRQPPASAEADMYVLALQLGLGG